MTDRMTTETHLWEHDHPYYCEDDGGREYQSWEEWHRANAGMDVDMNLIFRWDWHDSEQRRAAGDEPSWPGEGLLRLFIIEQRHGRLRVDIIENMRREDEPSVREVLAKHWATMRALWMPMSSPEEMASTWSLDERARLLIAHDKAAEL